MIRREKAEFASSKDEKEFLAKYKEASTILARLTAVAQLGGAPPGGEAILHRVRD